MAKPIETLERRSPLKIQPWLVSRHERMFNPALAYWNGRIFLFPRVNPYDVPENYSDVTDKYGVYTETSNGTHKTSEVRVRAMYEAAGFVSMEDWRCGETTHGENWVGVSLVRDESKKGSPKLLLPYAGLARLNVKNHNRVSIDKFMPLDDIGPAKNILPVSSENGLVIVAGRRERRAFDHTISFYEISTSSGKADYLRDEVIPTAPWCPDKVGLTGSPIILEPEFGQKSRQLWILHGSAKTGRGTYDEYEYAVGAGIRTVDQRGRINWQVTQQGLYTHPQTGEAIGDLGINPEDRDPTKKVVYSTGVLRTNGHLIIALSFGDWATFKVVERTADLIEAVKKSELLARAA